MSSYLHHLSISEILNKAEVEIADAEREILQWKSSKANKLSSQAITEAETELSLKLRDEENFSSLVKHSISTDALNDIEKRVRNLEQSREIDSEKQLKRMKKLEKVIKGFGEKSYVKYRDGAIDSSLKELTIGKSPKPTLGSNSDARIKNTRTRSSINLKERNKKNVRYCVYVKGMENDLEKWKSKARFLKDKCFVEIKTIKKEILEVKKELKKESQDLKQTCMSILRDHSLSKN